MTDQELYRVLERVGTLKDVEKAMTIAAYRVLGTRWKVAYVLGVNPSTVYKRLIRYGLIKKRKP